MSISLIAAVGKNGEIGLNDTLPWPNISEDKKMFRETTKGHTVIMGRKTFESIGKPLPDRTNIVITKNETYEAQGCIIVHSLEDALLRTINEPGAFIIGGAEIYEQAISYAEKIYLTVIDGEFKADTFFPEINLSEWRLVRSSAGNKKEGEPLNFSFIEYERIKQND